MSQFNYKIQITSPDFTGFRTSNAYFENNGAYIMKEKTVKRTNMVKQVKNIFYFSVYNNVIVLIHEIKISGSWKIFKPLT